MRRFGTYAVVLAAGTAVGLWARTQETVEPQLGHMVYFSLKDNSAEKMVEAVSLCQKYLSDHPGTVHFSVGTRAKEFDRPVNDREFDIALHMVFKSKADHDRYQTSDRHKQFVEAIQAHAKKVRVFDAAVVAK